MLHYPPQDANVGSHIRAGAHEDINTITLLLGAEEAGLELLTVTAAGFGVTQAGRGGVNIGDMLQRLTNGALRSTSTASSTRRLSARATRAIRCLSSSTSTRNS